MTQSQPSLLARPDTVLGVCQGMGEDTGIPSNLFRIAFAVALFFAPLASVATYFLLGLVVAATRYFFPIPSFDDSAVETGPAVKVEDDTLPLAA